MENKVNKDKNLEKEVDELLSRSVSAIYPSKEELKKVLLSGKKLRIYIGADATGPSLHIGHATNFMLLEKFQKLGHEAIVLFGDFTAMIGDPSGKDSSRVSLTQKEVKKNIATWEKQIKPVVSLGWRGAKLVKNSKWLSKLSFLDVIKLSSNFTVQQMIERDMFQKRINEEKPIYLNEFLYPLMQGYDSVALDVDIEIGGNDQTFNMLAGRILQKKINGREKFVIATTLLENPRTGKKLMNKSEGNVIGLSDSPEEMFGKTMALPDESIVSVIKDCTNVSLEKIEEIKESLTSGSNPKEIKMFLAEELVSIFHNKEIAKKARENFIKTFKDGGSPENIEECFVLADENLSDVLLRAKIIKSKSDFVRLVKEGAVSNIEKKEKIYDIFIKASTGIYKIGKHRFIKIIKE